MQCALCQNKVSSLCDSHLIPKLVYKRCKTRPNSRYRDLSNITKVLQDGEKHKMLCLSCERKLNAWETRFASDFLDPFISDKRIPRINCNSGWLKNYCLSVSWRLLHDDLYRMNSYIGQGQRVIFERLSEALRLYLNSDPVPDNPPSGFYNYIFNLSDFVKDETLRQVLEGFLFGYSYFDGRTRSYLVYSSYAGLVFTTIMNPKFYNVLEVGLSPFEPMNLLPRKQRVKRILRYEIKAHAKEIIAQYRKNMTPEMREKIAQRYRK